MRTTKARTALNNIFAASSKPLSALELLALLNKQDINVNKTTVYREVEFLKQQNLIREILFGDGKTRYEKLEEHCHHHVVCNNCGKIEDINIEEFKLLKLVEKTTHYKINSHSIEFFGLCSNCR